MLALDTRDGDVVVVHIWDGTDLPPTDFRWVGSGAHPPQRISIGWVAELATHLPPPPRKMRLGIEWPAGNLHPICCKPRLQPHTLHTPPYLYMLSRESLSVTLALGSTSLPLHTSHFPPHLRRLSQESLPVTLALGGSPSTRRHRALPLLTTSPVASAAADGPGGASLTLLLATGGQGTAACSREGMPQLGSAVPVLLPHALVTPELSGALRVGSWVKLKWLAPLVAGVRL